MSASASNPNVLAAKTADPACAGGNALRAAVKDAVTELLRKEFPDRYVFAPHLRVIGEKLQQALDCQTTLRPDVQIFAAKMAAVMDNKEAEKGSPSDLDLMGALMGLAAQNKILQEHDIWKYRGEMRRILIHIANFAMIAESKL